MFTLFRKELEPFARKTLEDHQRFDRGGWSQADLDRYQLDRLRETLRYVRTRSPFYAERLAGLDEKKIDALTLADLAQVPFTTKDDLRKRMYELLSKPISEAWIFYETTGTTGRSTPCPRDNQDSLVNNTALSVCYDAIFRQHGEDQVVGVLGPSELHSTGDTFGDVCRNLGRAVVKMWPHSPVVGFARALEVMRELPITSLFCTPGMAMSLAKEALKAGLDPRRDFKVRFFMFTGELATPGLLSSIGELWGAKAYNCLYASQEASILGVAHGDGRLRTVPLNVLYELIDPKTGLAVPDREEYRQGELVLTHLYQGSKPLVRYRTGDLVRLYPADPTAPYPSSIMLPLGRVRDLIDLNGHEVSAYELENLLLSRIKGCIDYQVTIDRVEGVDRLSIELEPELGQAINQAQLASALNAAATKAWGCPVTVSFARLGPITSTGAMVSWKAARVNDRRRPPDAEKQAAMAIAQRRESRPIPAAAEQRWAYHNGEFVRVGDIRLGPSTQGLHYGTGVFEGLRAYWDPTAGSSNLLLAAEHYKRMLDSARLLHLKIGHTAEELIQITCELLRRNGFREDTYVRPLAYKLALEPGTPFGVRLRGVSTALTILCMPMGQSKADAGLRCGTTSWRRIPDTSLPARAKITGAYANNALAFDEVTAAGYDDAIFLNQAGDVAEASTSNVFLVRGGRVITPGVDSDVLEGITRMAVIEMLADEANITVEQRAVQRSELYVADEVFLTATGKEIAPVIELDGRPIGSGAPGPITALVRKLYDQLVRGTHPRSKDWLTPVELDRSEK